MTGSPTNLWHAINIPIIPTIGWRDAYHWRAITRFVPKVLNWWEDIISVTCLLFAWDLRHVKEVNYVWPTTQRSCLVQVSCQNRCKPGSMFWTHEFHSNLLNHKSATQISQWVVANCNEVRKNEELLDYNGWSTCCNDFLLKVLFAMRSMKWWEKQCRKSCALPSEAMNGRSKEIIETRF